MSFDNNKLIANSIGLAFNLEYEVASNGIPKGVNFQYKDFKRPNIRGDENAINSSEKKNSQLPYLVVDTTSNGVCKRKVTFSTSSDISHE